MNTDTELIMETIHDQTERHEIQVTLRLSRYQLEMLYQMYDMDEGAKKDYIDAIIDAGHVTNNPSDALGEGAQINEVFSYGLMAYLRECLDLHVDPAQCTFHPLAQQRPKSCTAVAFEMEDIQMVDDTPVMRTAIDSRTGAVVHAADVPGIAMLDAMLEQIGVEMEGEELTQHPVTSHERNAGLYFRVGDQCYRLHPHAELDDGDWYALPIDGAEVDRHLGDGAHRKLYDQPSVEEAERNWNELPF